MPSKRVSVFQEDPYIIFGNDTPKHKFMKKQMMVALKQYGDGLQHLESLTIKYGEELIEKFKTQNHNPFDPRKYVRTCVTAIMLTLTYGNTPKEKIQEMQTGEDEIARFYGPAGIYLIFDLFPRLIGIIPPLYRAYVKMLRAVDKVKKCNQCIIIS